MILDFNRNAFDIDNITMNRHIFLNVKLKKARNTSSYTRDSH